MAVGVAFADLPPRSTASLAAFEMPGTNSATLMVVSTMLDDRPVGPHFENEPDLLLGRIRHGLRQAVNIRFSHTEFEGDDAIGHRAFSRR